MRIVPPESSGLSQEPKERQSVTQSFRLWLTVRNKVLIKSNLAFLMNKKVLNCNHGDEEGRTRPDDQMRDIIDMMSKEQSSSTSSSICIFFYFLLNEWKSDCIKERWCNIRIHNDLCLMHLEWSSFNHGLEPSSNYSREDDDWKLISLLITSWP